MDVPQSAAEAVEEGSCAFLALLSGVLPPDQERGMSGDFAVFSQDGGYAAIALPWTAEDEESPTLQVNDFFLPWAVGSLTTEAPDSKSKRTVGFAWRYTELCLALNEPELRVELGVPSTEESIPLYLPAFRLDAPFESSTCQVTMLDVSQTAFRACGYASCGDTVRPIVWHRVGGESQRLIATDIGERLSAEVRARFDGALGFLKDGRLEVTADGVAQPDVLTV